MMIPYCYGHFWVCARGTVLGSISLGTSFLGVYMLSKMIPVSVIYPQYRVSVVLVALAVVEMSLVFLRCVLIHEPKLMIGAKYCRGLQISISCWLYGNLACEITRRKALMYGLLAPLLICVGVLMTGDIIFMLQAEFVDCHHSSWLVMSIASAVLAVGFALSGKVVLQEIVSVSMIHKQFSNGNSIGHENQLTQSYNQLWLLILANMVTAVLQLLFDIYIAYIVTGDKTCSNMFYDSEDGAIEQIIRLVIALICFVLPEWVTLYVFYWIPRYQFTTTLDVPAIDFDNDETKYELLLPEDERLLNYKL